MYKSIVSIVVVLGILFGVTSVYASEVTEAVVGAAKAVETGVGQDLLKESLVGIINGVVSAKEFLVKQVPDVVQQLLMWKMLESLAGVILGVGFGILVCAGATWFFLRVTEEWQKSYFTSGFDHMILILGNLIGGGIVLGTFELTWLQIWVAPKVYLIEYAAALVK